MFLKNIKLLNFKNYNSLEIFPSKQINCILGTNGSGKTNLLDAIHYLSLGKSAFNFVDSQNILHDRNFFLIQSNYIKNTKNHLINCSLKRGQKKIMSLDDIKYEKISDHVGEIPVVLIAPNDTDIIRQGSELRRKFFDSIFSQSDSGYLKNLIRYHNLLKQRNSLLLQFLERNYFDAVLLDHFDEQLISIGLIIHKSRAKFLENFFIYFTKHYQCLSNDSEEVAIEYKSHYTSSSPENLFLEKRELDRMLKRTHVGVHKDDFEFKIDGYPLKKFGSQGQQKSFLIALKLAQFDLIKNGRGFKPILLLDDIFDKLDDQRIARLMELTADKHFGQLFVTDARPERSKGLFEKMSVEMKFFEIENGTLL